MDIQKDHDDLPTNVGSKDQLALLPPEFLSDCTKRPLKNTDSDGTTYTYALRPLYYSVILILLIEGLERFAYYGINFSQTNYLIGTYNHQWNANMTTSEATSFVSATTGLAYTAPFIGGIISDALLGDYWGIIFGTAVFYLPGLILVALTTYPYLLGSVFNQQALTAGMLVLFPLGTGFIKSLVNVFGAKQYHPKLQSTMVESYYVNFYMAINIGALLGGIMVPLLAQINVSVAYTIPACALGVGFLIFLLGSSRYVKAKPSKDALLKTVTLLGKSTLGKPMEESKKKNGGAFDDTFVDGVKHLLAIIPITALVIPFNIAYSQMSTVFILQGNAMQAAGLFDSSMMNNWDAVSVLIFGGLVGSYLYPYLARRNVHIAITHKFAIGTGLGVLALLCAIFVDYGVHAALSNGTQISVFYQIFSYMFIGAGEIFAIASAYDAAFSIAPKEQKGLASAINLFFVGAVPNFICVALSNAFKSWFPQGNESSPEEYLEAYKASKLYDYLWVLVGIALFGIVINILPPVNSFVERVHQQALQNNISAANHNNVDTTANDDKIIKTELALEIESNESRTEKDEN